MKAIIFGINSQDGYYLNETCKRNGVEVKGVSRSNGNWINGNVNDISFVENLIKKNQPDYIFHIAANSTTKHEVIFENHETISTGTLNILENVKKYCPSCKVFITGSGVQFVNKGFPIKETDEFEASSAYAIARIQSVYAARYFRSLGIRIYVGYLFHHESAFRKPNHVSKFTTDAIKKIATQDSVKIEMQNVEIRKEWAFAGDIAEGIFTLVSQDNVFEATIGTGVAYSIKDWLRVCFDMIGKNWEDFVTLSCAENVAEYKLLLSNPATINKLGWKATTSFRQLAKIMMQEK